MKTDTGSASRYIRLTLTLGSIALLTLALAGDSSVRVFADKPGEYDLTWADPADEVDLPAVYRAVNLAQGMRLYFGETGVALAPEQSHADGWSLGIEVAGYGYADEVTPVGGASLEADANRIDYAFSEALSGWYLNGARGLQQGFTLAAPTHRLAPDSRPHVDFVLSGDPVAFLSDDGATLWLAQSHHEAFLRYSLLQATTRTGSQLQARFEVVSDGRGAPVGLRLLVSEGVSAAAYPISLELLAESGAGVSTASAVYPTSYELLAGSGASADLGAGSLSGPLQALEGPGSSGGQATPLAATAAQSFVTEIEPNGTPLTATPLGGLNVVAFGNVFPGIEDDYYSLTVNGGDRVYVATMGGFSAASGSGDTAINVYDSDGTTSLEFDDDDGVFGTFSSSIAGVTVPGSGSKTIFIKVRGFGGGAVGPGSTQVRPYHLHVRVQQSGAPISDAPTPEAAEPNDGFAFFLPPNGWVSGTFGATGDLDFYAITLAAGESVYISADWNPERDAITWDGRIFFGPFGDGAGSLIALNDASVTSPNSDAAFWTVKNAGVYQILVTGVTFAPSLTYNLSVSVHPAVPATSTCTTYPYTGPAVTLGPGPSTTPASASITVPGPSPRRIADLDVSIELTHSLMADLDVHLRSPALNDNGLFTDIGAPATAGQISMDTILDDEAASSIQSSSGSGFPLHLRGNVLQPEQAYRLHWFDGEDAVGTWTLDLRDDANAASGGTLTAWSLTICEPAPPPSCAGTPVTLLSTDFEAGAAGFTTAGTANEWELGLPTFAPITTCNSGTSCWKTDLDNTYDVSSNQDLLSPSVSLLGLTGPITATWAHRYQMQSSQTGTINPDRFIVEVREVPSANPKSLFEFFDFTMTNSVGGTTAVTLNESGGWGVFSKDISSYANKTVQLRFNLTSDTSTNLAGLAIDDVTITACCTAASCNDNNPCTDDVCTAAGCTHMNNSGSCEDGNPCTGPDVCAGGACVPGPNPCDDGDACTEDVCDGGGGCSYPPVDCNDGNPCTNDGCDSVTGCFNVPNTDPCDDGNACTINDQCGGGTCLPGPGPALVQFCNTGSISIPDSGTATPYPSNLSVSGQPPVLCKATVNLNGVTHTFPVDIDVLLVAPGTVSNSIIMSDVGGTAAVSGINLTLDDAAPSPLSTSTLVSGTFKPTNFGTGDVFAAPAPASSPADNATLAVLNGSNPNGTWKLFVVDDVGGDLGSISGGWCVNVGSVCTDDSMCDDGNPCTDDACDRGACVHDNNTDPCDDGNPCTDPDVCGGGECIPGTNPCDDGDACTEDVCDGGGGCSYPLVDCNDANPCTNDGCDSVTGCFNVPNSDPCSDGNPCTINDACAGGACVPGPLPAPVSFCNAGSISIPASGSATPYPSSISVSGQPLTLCKTTVDLKALVHTFPDDVDMLLVAPGTVTNAIIMSDVGGGTDVPNPPATVLNLTLDDAAATSLPDGGPLASGTFKPTNIGVGDVFAAPAPAAGGGSALSAFNGSNPNGSWSLYVTDQFTPDGGALSGGWCVNLRMVCTSDAECDDGNPCTDDACDRGACVHDNNTDPCDDGDSCSMDDTCAAGSCSGTPIDCDDGIDCTIDGCDEVCTHTPDDGACSNGLFCDGDEVCNPVSGCEPGTPPDCDDGIGCTIDSCDTGSDSCENAPDDGACDDGDPCTVDTCTAGGCDYEFICCDEPQPRSSGFYKRMCNPANPPQANPLSQADADCVNDTCTFADVESVEDMCEILTSVAGPCARAEREFMALAINICRGQICEGDPISSDCAGNNSTTAGEALAQGDALLCNASPSVSDCFTAACVSYDINSGRAINVDAMTADKIIGNHVRLTWQLPLHDPAKSIVLYRVWRSVDGGPWALVGEVPPNVPKTWVDTTAQGLARCDYQVTAVLE